MALPAHLQYQLTRSQRLTPHLVIWHWMGPLLLVAFGCSIWACLMRSAWFGLLVVVFWWSVRGYVGGLLDVLLHPVREMDIIIEPLGIGYLDGQQRWYIHLDGVYAMQQIVEGVWTICHANGSVINVPAESMPEECSTHIRAAIDGRWDYLQPFADEHRRKLEARQQEGSS